MRCPTCNREIGTEVEPGEFNLVSKLRKAGVAQWCAECIKMVDPDVIINLRSDPQFFIDNARLKRKYDPFGKRERLTFPGNPIVIKTNPRPGIAGNARMS